MSLRERSSRTISSFTRGLLRQVKAFLAMTDALNYQTPVQANPSRAAKDSHVRGFDLPDP